jgi:hypothetical protein
MKFKEEFRRKHLLAQAWAEAPGTRFCSLNTNSPRTSLEIPVALLLSHRAP